MKRCLIAFTILVLAGCATPTQQWAQQAIALNAAENVVVDLHESGVMSDATLIMIGDYGIKPARAAVDAAETFLPNGGPAFKQYLSQAKAALIVVSEAEALK
jgi:hypothetical protein